jgi:hypothetical protein
MGINASTTSGCAAAVTARGCGCRFGCYTGVFCACPMGAVGETPPCFEPMLLMASAVMAPTRSTHPAVAAASRSVRRSLAGRSWASATADGDDSDEGIVALCSGRSGATRAGPGSESRFRARCASSGSTSTSSGLMGPRSRGPRREGGSRRLASSAPRGSIDAREEAGMRAVRPGTSSSRRRVSPSVEFLEVSADWRPRERSGKSNNCRFGGRGSPRAEWLKAPGRQPRKGQP